MDGKNGVYRYNYNNRPGGLGPYELTGHLTIGWWSFLQTSRSRSLYETLSTNYPLEEGKVVSYYQRSIHSKFTRVKSLARLIGTKCLILR